MSAVLIRQTVVRADGTDERLETELDVASVVVGSAPDCQVILPGVAPRHAVLGIGRGGARMTRVGRNRVLVNGAERRHARLKPGDVMEVGAHRIEVLAAPTGFALGLDVRRGPESAGPGDWAKAHVTSLEQAGLRRRPWVWRLSWAALLLGLVAPFVVSLLIPQDSWTAPWFLTDAVWSSGEISTVHRFGTEAGCARCHTALFRRVKDDACRQCHEQLNDHAGIEVLAANDFRTGRCARCHREHDEPSTLLATGDATCLDCHGRDEGFKGSAGEVGGVRGFGEQAHPQFKVTFTVLGPNDAAQDPWVSRTTSIEGARDATNLKFPHDAHLDKQKVSNLRTGETLGCASCHEAATDGEHFLPVQMERHCAQCHELGFDDDDPFRQLPHGDAREAILVMEGHFLKKVLAPPPKRMDGFKWRRIPDRPPRGSSECARGDIACAGRLFAAEANDQFLKTGCVTCHKVTVRAGQTHLADRYAVIPVRLTDDFMPQARFNHTAHRVLGDKKGIEACLACHAAARSHEPTDVLLPGIETCVDCHADYSVASRAPMQCANCHQYHPPHAALNAMPKP